MKNKKVLIILGVLLLCCCIFAAILGYIVYSGSQRFSQQLADQAQQKKAVKVNKTDNQPISTDDSAYTNFKVGDSIRINNEYVITIVSVKEQFYDKSFPGFTDPFKGTYLVINAELVNISDNKVTVPNLKFYDSATGVGDSIGEKTFLDLPDFPVFTTIDPGKKVSGDFQFKEQAGSKKANYYLQIEDTFGLTSTSPTVEIKLF